MTEIDTNKIRQLDGSLLLVLQALMRHRRTTAAAEQLGLSQSAISHALTRLRRLFGDPLFVRRPHGLEPTRHALELAPRIDALVAAAHEAMGLSASFDPATTTRGFRLGSSDFLATLLAPTLLRAFETEAPKARFAFGLVLGEDALKSLRLDEIDVALGRFPRRLGDFQVTQLFSDAYCLVSRAGHPKIKSKPSKSEFEALEHVAISVGGDFRTFTDPDFANLGIARQVVAAVPNFTIAFAMVGQSDAVCVAPRRLAMTYRAAHDLSLHDLPAPLPPIEVIAVRRPTPDLGVDWLLERIRRAMANESLAA